MIVEMQKNLPCLFVLVLSSCAVRSVEANSQLDHLDSALRSSRRVKRSSLSEAEVLEVTDIHNYVRSLEGASDMQTMRYNYELADLAQAWADQCQWYHGQAKPIRTEILGYKHVGQNMYAISGAPYINLTNVTLSWYNEKPYYNYDTNVCPSDEMCGHYTQVVWADSYDIGCGQKTCPFLNQSDIRGPATILVCNYGPSGNINETRPFNKGQDCSNCSNGQFWCTDQGLCNKSCSSNPGPPCVCAASCQNGGTQVDSNCTCKCPKGWGYFDCSKKCENYHGYCDPPPGQYGWPPEWCNHPVYGETVRRYCLFMCKQCTKCSGSVKGYSPALISTSWIVSLLLSVFNLRN